MIKKRINEKEALEETPKVKETPKVSETSGETSDQGRMQLFFFPKYRKTIYATSIEEAYKKIKEQNE